MRPKTTGSHFCDSSHNIVPSENDMLENACVNDTRGSMFVVEEGVNFLTRDLLLSRIHKEDKG